MGPHTECPALPAAAVAGVRASLQEGHPHTGVLLGLRGQMRTQLDRYEEAEADLLESHGILAASFGPTHPGPIGRAPAIAKLYDTWNNPEQAAQYRALLPPGADVAPENTATETE